MAKVFCESGEFLWNSGMFIWKLSTINKALEEHLPQLNALFDKGKEKYMTTKEQEFINSIYADCQNISIDYGIMEKANNVGTWGALYAHSSQDNHENSIIGKNIRLYDSSGCIVHIPDENIAIVQGLEGYIVVQRENRILICKRDDEQQIRQFVNELMLESATDFI